MNQRIFDTKTRTLRDFEPLTPGRVSMYVCGATPQAKPHIGHLRSGVAFDIVRRWFLANGYDVAFVRNVTDIDDKILAKSADNGVPWNTSTPACHAVTAAGSIEVTAPRSPAA